MMLNLHERATPERTFTQTKGNNVPPSTVDFFGYRIDNDSTEDLEIDESSPADSESRHEHSIYPAEASYVPGTYSI